MSLFFHRSTTTTAKTKPAMRHETHLDHKGAMKMSPSTLPPTTTAPSFQPEVKVPRIPLALQTIFVQSNRGEEVHVPPPRRIASRIFRTLTFRGRRHTTNTPKTTTGSSNGRNCRKGPISFTTASPDHTATTTNNNNSRSGSSYDDPTFIVEVNHHNDASGATSSYSSSTSTSFSESKDTPIEPKNHDMSVTPPLGTITGTAAMKKEVTLTITPLSYVDAMLQSRGYSTTKYNALQTSYYNQPTTYQQLCYDTYILKLVKQTEQDNTRSATTGSLHALKQLLLAGISSNPCNAHGESLLHTICRLGRGSSQDSRIPMSNNTNTSTTLTPTRTTKSWSYELLQIMISIGHVDVSNCVDDYGRTPLHDACWCHSICYDTIALLLQQDPTLIVLQDCRGATPLSYIPPQHHTTFIEFIARYKDQFFPDIRGGNSPQKTVPPFPSRLVQGPPNRRPVPDPANALSHDVARMVVSGRITPQELTILLLQDHDDDDDDDDESESESESSYDDDDLMADEGDDSSTILSTEGDHILSPRIKDTREVVRNGSAISDCDEGSDDDDDDDDESYSDLEEMLMRLKSPTAAVLNKDHEAVLGIGRPQYGYEMMATTNHHESKTKKSQDSNYHDSKLDGDDGHNDIYVDSRMNDYVKPMSSDAIPTTIHCNSSIGIEDTLRSSVVTSTTTSLNHPSSNSRTRLENHPIRDTTNDLLEFSV